MMRAGAVLAHRNGLVRCSPAGVREQGIDTRGFPRNLGRPIVRHSTLDGLEYRLLSALVEGKSVTDAIEQVAQSGGADFDRLAANLHEWFRHWAASGFFQAVELPEAAEPKPG